MDIQKNRGRTADEKPMCIGFLEKWIGPSEYVFFGDVGPSSVGVSTDQLTALRAFEKRWCKCAAH